MMNFVAHANDISAKVEILTVGAHGLWLLVEGFEHFLSYDDFPWFKEAKIGQIIKVVLLHPGYLYWPDLDIDLSVRNLSEPSAFPLKEKS